MAVFARPEVACVVAICIAKVDICFGSLIVFLEGEIMPHVAGITRWRLLAIVGNITVRRRLFTTRHHVVSGLRSKRIEGPVATQAVFRSARKRLCRRLRSHTTRKTDPEKKAKKRQAA
jgi:hypothetical protein